MEKVHNKVYICLLLIISIFLFSSSGFSGEVKPQNYEKTNEYYQNLLQALNLITFSLHRICSVYTSNSMIKAEYYYILNNIDLDKIPLPEQIEDVYQEIINALSELKIEKEKLPEEIELLEKQPQQYYTPQSYEIMEAIINAQNLNIETPNSLMNCSKILYFRFLLDNSSYPLHKEQNEQVVKTFSGLIKKWKEVIQPYFYNQILPKLPDAFLIDERTIHLLLRNFYARDLSLCLKSFNDMQNMEKGIVQVPIYWLLYTFSSSRGKNIELTELCINKFLECYKSVLKKDIFLEVVYIRKLEILLLKNPEFKDENINQQMLDTVETAYKYINDKNIIYKIYFSAIFRRLNKIEKTQELLLGINPELIDKENKTEYAFYKLAMYDLNHGYDILEHMKLLAKVLIRSSATIEQLEEIKETKIPEVLYYLGTKYIYAQENRDVEKGLAYIEEASTLGYTEAISFLAYGYMYGYTPGMKKDEKKGFEYFQMLAEKGEQKALCEIGRCYYLGKVVPQDFNKAKEYFEKSGKDGKYWLGVMYSKGEGVPQDYQKAHEYFYDVIQDDYTPYVGYGNSYREEAYMALGDLYFTGKIDVVNYLKAMFYYERAAHIPEAQVKMGYIYENGYEIQKSYSKAKECYEKAGRAGNLDALLRLGDFYLYGLAGKKDYVLSYAHYTLVIRLVNEGSEHPQARELAQQAEQTRKKLLPNIWNFWSGLTPEEIKKAEDIARSWKPGSLLTREKH